MRIPFTSRRSPLFLTFFITTFSFLVTGQPSIAWQRSIGTEQSDTALKLFPDRDGNLIVIGSEPHQDFTGNFRDYMVILKLDPDGNEIWKTYHDVAFETFNPPLDYSLGAHFFTEEFGEKLINLVVSINNRSLLLKLLESNGQYFYYEDIASPLIDVQSNNDKVYAVTQCSYQFACYGPDSLIVQKFDQTPDSLIFNPIKWTYETRQNIRTAPIQGHYDFDGQDIREDSAGNVYLLIQIERWDFQFCTDCNDAFIDAWCEVFKFSPQGVLLRHQKIMTSKAVVSGMSFVAFDDDGMIIRVDDINASNTAIVSSVFHVNPELQVTKTIKLDRQYIFIGADEENNLYTCTNLYDPNDPDIHGESDILVAKFDDAGVLQWKKNFGGSGFEWPRGLIVAEDDLVILGNTQSNDFDVVTNLGGQDIWLVDLSETSASGGPTKDITEVVVCPNPVHDQFQILGLSNAAQLEVFDVNGKEIRSMTIQPGGFISIKDIPTGLYWIRVRSDDGVMTGRVVKQ